MDFDDYCCRVVKAGIANENEILGLPESEISVIEKTTGLTLPKRYKEFLLAMGANFGERSDVAGFTALDGRGIVKRHETNLFDWDVQPPTGIFCFTSEFGIYCYFFHTSAGDDPPVYSYIFGQKESPELVANTFTEFLELMLQTQFALPKFYYESRAYRKQGKSE